LKRLLAFIGPGLPLEGAALARPAVGARSIRAKFIAGILRLPFLIPPGEYNKKRA